MDDFETLKRRCLAPISEEAPYGDDPRQSEEFKTVRSIVGRYGDPLTKEIAADPEEPKQWELAIENCALILSSQGKDLRVLCWLCGALVSIRGIRGMQTGLEILRRFLEGDMEALHPVGVRPKVNAFSWLGEFLEFALEKYNKYLTDNADALDSDDAAALKGMKEELDLFYAAANEKLYDDQFDFKHYKKAQQHAQDLLKFAPLRTRVVDEEEASSTIAPQISSESQKTVMPQDRDTKGSAVVEHKPEVMIEENRKTEPDPRSEPKERAASVGSVRQETAVAESEDDAKPDKVSLIRDLAALAFKLRVVAPHEPLAFRLLRLAKWSLIVNPPPTLPKTKRTRLGGPRTEFNILQAREKRLAKNESFDHLAFIETCELWFNKYPFWLDLQLIIHDSAAALRLEDLKETVTEETRRLIARLGDEFIELEFKDGAPFASEATKKWLKSLTAAAAVRAAELPPPVIRRPVVEPQPPPAAAVLPPASVVQPMVVLTTDKPVTELDQFIHALFRQISSGKAAEALQVAEPRLAAAQSPLDRWRLLRICGLAAAALPNKKMAAVAILRECRAAAEAISLRRVLPVEYSETLLALRDLGGSDGADNLSAAGREWLAITGEALRVDPSSVIRRELLGTATSQSIA